MIYQEDKKDVNAIFLMLLSKSNNDGEGCIKLGDIVKDIACSIGWAVHVLHFLKEEGVLLLECPKSFDAHTMIHFEILNKSLCGDSLWAV